MHICFFSGDITRSGGTERVSAMIANMLAKSTDYKISFVSLFEEANKPFFAIDDAIDRHVIYPVPTHGIQHYFTTVKRLKTLVKQLRIDVLVDIDGILDMYALPVKRSTGVKVISWEHFNYHQNPGVPYRKLTRRWAVRRADAIVTLTQADKVLYESNLKLRCPVVAIPNPIEPLAGENRPYSADSRTILSCGRLTYQKGFDYLIQVAAKVLPEHPGWTWLVLGEGEDREQLEQGIREHHLEGRVVLEGRVDNVEDYYRKSAFYVMTSRFEGLPMVLLEAKSAHLPIVSFDCETGPAEIVKDGVNGYLVPCFDTDGMTKRIGELIDDAELRERFSAHAMDDTERYAMRTVAIKWINLFKVSLK